MDDEALTSEFFTWVEEAEDYLEFIVSFESLNNATLTFYMDSNVVKYHIGTGQIACITGNSIIKSTCEMISQDLPSKALAEFLGLITEKYQEIKDFEGDGGSADSDIDYRAEILQLEQEELLEQAQKLGRPVSGASLLGSSAMNHFVFREAAESIHLLEQTILNCPGLEYSCRILNHSGVCNVRIELNLSFISILDSAMLMLGLTYDHPLVISISLSENFVSQTFHQSEWTPGLVGALKFTVLQGGMAENYGCKYYVLGRVQKYRDDIYNMLRQNSDIPLQLVLSRENSADDPKVTVPSEDLLMKLVNIGFSASQASSALKTSGNDFSVALDMLTTGVVNGYRGEFQESVIQCNNFFYNLVFYLRDKLQNCTSYCVICYKRHASDSIRLRPCSQEICEFKFEEVSGLSLYAELRSNIHLVTLDLSFAAAALASGRAHNVFEPFPSFMLKEAQLRGKSGFLDRNSQVAYAAKMDSNKNIGLLTQVFKLIPSPTVLRRSATNEESVIELINSHAGDQGHLVYKLMKYIIATNRLTLVKLETSAKIQAIPDKMEQYIVSGHPPETMRHFNNLKRQRGSFFAFHGSALENWYSILRNGLRSLSNTHMMTAGAAAGAGVYTAESISTSIAYARLGANDASFWPNGVLSNSGCIAIVEIINSSDYRQGEIYVVRNDREIIVRYLLIFSADQYTSMNFNATSLNIEKHLSDFRKKYNEKHKKIKQERRQQAIAKMKKQHSATLSQEIIVEEEKKASIIESKVENIAEKFSGTGSAMATKRILQEYKYLLKSKECQGLSVEFENSSNIYVWLVALKTDQFELPRQLQQDFEHYAAHNKCAKELLFEVRFDSNFPYNPPFVRVVRPRFSFRTGHITIGGSICMESLTPSGWIPVRTVESIFIEILYNISDGEPRLDARSFAIDYNLADAQEAFTRVARQHNWMK